MTDPELPSAPAAPAPVKLTERPHPLTPFVRGWVVVLAIAVSVGREFVQREPGQPLPPVGWIVSVGALIAVAAALAGYASWRFTRFVIDTDELRVDTGVFQKRSTQVAFDKLQAIDIVQPLAARLVGLAELHLDVGSHQRVQLRYLSVDRAHALRDYLLARARGHRAEVVVAAEPASVFTGLGAADEVLIQVPPQTLLLAAVTSHEFFAILGSGLVMVGLGVYFDLGWGWLAILVPLASSIFGFVTRRVTGQFNYTLSRREHGLRISRGLTNLTSQSLPARRVQAVQLSQSPIWRWLGLYRLDVEVIGWGQLTTDENDSGVSTILLPAGSIEQVRIAVAAIWPGVDFEAVHLHRPPARARWRHPLAAPFLGWGYDQQLVVSRQGWLVRRWQLVPAARVQSVRVSQGPLERRLQLARLEFHTGGGSIAAQARGLDASGVLGWQDEVLAAVHHRPARDLSEQPAPAGSLGQADAGPDAVRADHAEATISSTE